MRKFTIILLLFSSYAVFAQNSPILVKDIGNPGDQAIFHGDNVWPMGEQYQIGQTQNYLYFIDEKQIAIPIFDLEDSDKLTLLASSEKRAFLLSPDGRILQTDGTQKGTFWIDSPVLTASYSSWNRTLADASNDTLVFMAAQNGVSNLYLLCDANPSPQQLTNWIAHETLSYFDNVLLRGDYVIFSKNSNNSLYTFNLNNGILNELINNAEIIYNKQEWNNKPAFFINYFNNPNLSYELVATDGTPANTENIPIPLKLNHLSIIDGKILGTNYNDKALLVSKDGQIADTITCPSEVLLSTSLFYDSNQPFFHDNRNRLIIPFKNGNTFGFWLGNQDTQTIWNIGNVKIFEVLAVINNQIFFSSKEDNFGESSLYAADSTGAYLVGEGEYRFPYPIDVLFTSNGLLTQKISNSQSAIPEWIVVNPNNLTTQLLNVRLPSSAVWGGPSWFIRFGAKKLLFQADHGTEQEKHKIWISDGTQAGTYPDTLFYSVPLNYQNEIFTFGDYIFNKLTRYNHPSYVVSHKEGQAKWDTLLYLNDRNIIYQLIGGKMYLYTPNSVWETDGTIPGTVQLLTLPGAGMNSYQLSGDSNYLYYPLLDDTKLNKSFVQYNISTGQQTTLETFSNLTDVEPGNMSPFYYYIVEYTPVDTIRTLIAPGVARYTSNSYFRIKYPVTYNGALYGVENSNPNQIFRYSGDKKVGFGNFHRILHAEQRENELMIIAQSAENGPFQIWRFDLNSHELNLVNEFARQLNINGYWVIKGNEKNTFFLQYNINTEEVTIWNMGPNFKEVMPISYFKGKIEFWDITSIIVLDDTLYFWMNTPELGTELWKFKPNTKPSPYLHNIAPIALATNPSRGDVQAFLPPQLVKLSNFSLSIVNSTGQIVRSFTPDSPLVTISRQGLTAGYYTVVLHQINGPIVGVGRLVWID